MTERPRILCVDDEENILKAIVRSLRKRWDVATAGGGREALELLAAADAPFPVIISDMRMPGMNGAEFLEQARRIHPDSVRILLTGHADLEAVVAAVNKGHIYRFLAKPCPVEALDGALRDALRQYELVNAERILLERTLKGSIRAMTDILAAASPAAFGHADRLRRSALALARSAGLPADWRIEVAAMLSQLGCVTLPPDTAARYYRGETLSGREREMIERLPAVAGGILASIPRLETILEMIGPEEPTAAPGARAGDRSRLAEVVKFRAVLRLAGDAERLRAAGWTTSRIRDRFRAQEDVYAPDLLRHWEELAGDGDADDGVRGLAVHEVRVGMVLTEDVRTEDGLLLVAAGQEVTLGLLERISNFHSTKGLQEPLWVRDPEAEEAPADEPVPV